MTVAGQITDQDIDAALKAWRPVMGLSEGQYLPVVRYDKAADGSVTDILIPFGDTMREAMRAALESQRRREAEAGTRSSWSQKAAIEQALERLWDRQVAGEQPSYPETLEAISNALAASPSSPASGVRVKALEWQSVTDQIPKHAFAAYTPFSRWLIVCEFLSMNHMVYRFNDADYETLAEAKAAAQADYEARIRSALGEHP